MNRQLAPGDVEKTGSCCFCVFYFLVSSIIGGNCKLLEDSYYVYNGYENVMQYHGIIIWPFSWDFIRVLVVSGWLTMVYWLYVETAWIHKGKAGSYSERRYTGDGSYGGYSGGYSRYGGSSAGGYTSDGSYDGYSRDVYDKRTYRKEQATRGEKRGGTLKGKVTGKAKSTRKGDQRGG